MGGLLLVIALGVCLSHVRARGFGTCQGMVWFGLVWFGTVQYEMIGVWLVHSMVWSGISWCTAGFLLSVLCMHACWLALKAVR